MDPNNDINAFLDSHEWVPYYGPANLSISPKDREWADKHSVWICKHCRIWIWRNCPKN